MKTVTYYVPAFDLNEAREVAYAVQAGRMKHVEHYLDEAAAERVCAHLNRLGSKPRQVFTILLEQRVTDDGRIPVAWPVDRIGSIAAALLLIIGGPFLVGLATLV
jgi:hypothetical protein